MKKLICIPVVLILLAGIGIPAPSPVLADHTNLEEGLPVEVEDAYPTPYLNREVQGFLRYERTDEGKSFGAFQPRLEYGLARNWQATLEAPFFAGRSDDTEGSGDARLSLLYNFNTESEYLPAFALAAGADFPSGKHSRGVDPRAKLILSKMPWTSYRLFRLHLNLEWMRNSKRSEDEREERLKGVLGFSCRAGKDSTFVADIVREQEREKRENSTMVEAGIRTQLTPLTVLSFGAGAGMGEESPDYRITVGAQHSF